MTDRTLAIRITAIPADANAYKDILGGWLLGLMDHGGTVAPASPSSVGGA